MNIGMVTIKEPCVTSTVWFSLLDIHLSISSKVIKSFAESPKVTAIAEYDGSKGNRRSHGCSQLRIRSQWAMLSWLSSKWSVS